MRSSKIYDINKIEHCCMQKTFLLLFVNTLTFGSGGFWGSISDMIFKSIKETNIWVAIKCERKGSRGEGCSIRNIFESKLPEYSLFIHHDSIWLFSKLGTITNFSYETNICTNRCKNSSLTHRVNCLIIISSSSLFSPSGVISLMEVSFSIFFE